MGGGKERGRGGRRRKLGGAGRGGTFYSDWLTELEVEDVGPIPEFLVAEGGASGEKGED